MTRKHPLLTVVSHRRVNSPSSTPIIQPCLYISVFYFFSFRENSKRLNSEALPFYYWTENGRFHEGSLDSFDVIPGQDNSVGADDDDNDPGDAGPRRNPLRLHRLIRNQRESVAHFVPSRAFLPARNARTVRQEHHRPRAGVPPPSGFLFPIDEETEMSSVGCGAGD